MVGNGWADAVEGRAQYETIETTEPSVGGTYKKPSLMARISHQKSRFLHAYERFFLTLGGFIFDYPLWFIGISLFVVLICSLSFFFIHFETRADLLYALPASRARSDLAKLTTGFDVPPRVNMVFVVSRNNETILTPSVLRKMDRLDHYIKHQLKSSPYRKSGSEERVWSYEDVCYRQRLPDVNFSAVAEAEDASARRRRRLGPNTDDQCYTMTPLDLYRSPRQYGTPLATRQWPYIPNIAANKIVKADLVLADPHIVKLSSGTTRLLNATGFLFLYHSESADPSRLVASLAWEEALISFINNDIKPYAAPEANARRVHRLEAERRQYEETYYTVEELSKMDTTNTFAPFDDLDWTDYHVFVNAQRSWQDELSRSTSLDARLMRDYCLAFLIIATYMITMNRTNNLVRSKSICGFVGALSALFGFVVGGGICYWLGLRHTPTMHAAPFLVLAIGLDNTFVVLNFYTLAHAYAKDPRKRCAMSLSDAGISITITTSTSIISFLVGAVGPYLAVRNFCYVTAMGLAGGYIMNIVLFFPFLCLEAVAESKNDLLFVPVPKWVVQHVLPRRFIPNRAWNKIFPEPFNAAGAQLTSLEMQRTDHSSESGRPNPLSATMPFVPLFGTQPIQKGSATPPTSPRTGHHQPQPNFNQTQPIPHGHLHATYRHQPYAGFRTGTSRTDSDVYEDKVPGLSLPSDNSNSADDGIGSPPPFLRDRSLGGEVLPVEDLKRLRYIYDTFFPGKTIFELASIQWRFTKRLRELRRELRRRSMPIPSNINDLNLTMVRPEDLKLIDPLLTPPPQIPHTVLPALTHIVRLVSKAADEPDGNVGKVSRGVFLNFLGPLISRPWVQIAVLLGMVTYLSASLYGAVTRLSAGLDLENLTPPDSYLREAFALSHDKFPIFPYETSVLFTAPDYRQLSSLAGKEENNVDQGQSLLEKYDSNEYGTRRASDLKPLRLDDPEAYSGSGAGTAASMETYWNTLGEVPWWEPGTVQGLFDLDRALRDMPTTQDILNGMLLFYIEHSQRILEEGKTHEDRRVLFHQLLYRWLKNGVVGQHVRNQFRFGDPHPSDPKGLPRLLGFRLMIFNYNFLNSFEQSQYMLEIRDKCARASTDWRALYEDGEARSIESGEEMESQISHPMFALEKATKPEYPRLMVPPPPPLPASGRLEVGTSAAVPGQGKIVRNDQWSLEWQPLFSAGPFMETFLYFESDITILSATIINMATAFIAIVLVSFMLMRGWLTSVLVTLMICCVDLGIFGFMGFWGIHLNILSMILLVLSIGFSVDYTVHVVHTFTHCYGSTRKDKMVETLILMCNPVTHGAVSTLLGVLPIAFRDEFIMETFYRMTLLVVVFGFLNGVLFLPIILGICGPVFTETKRDTRKMELEIAAKMKPLWREEEEIKSIQNDEKILIRPRSIEEKSTRLAR